MTRGWTNRIDGLAARAVAALPALAALALLLVLAWRAATWFWVVLPPPSSSASPTRALDGAATAAARHWFGEAAAVAPAPELGAARAAAPAAELRLLGAISGGRKPAAMLAVGKSSFEVLLGETFGDGYRLVAVEADHVSVERQGRRFRVDLPVAANAGAPTSTLPAPGAAAASPSGPLPAASASAASIPAPAAAPSAFGAGVSLEAATTPTAAAPIRTPKRWPEPAANPPR